LRDDDAVALIARKLQRKNQLDLDLETTKEEFEIYCMGFADSDARYLRKWSEYTYQPKFACVPGFIK